MSSYIRLSDGVKKGFEQDMVQALSTLGYYAMLDAYKKHSFKHRTRNLHDSYASAVYVNGTLIKKNMPKFNVLLKDDKTYPYIKINVKSDYPDIYITRKILNDGARYFRTLCKLWKC